LRITLGAKGLEKGTIELRTRREGTTEEVPLAEVVKKIGGMLAEATQS
jgi:hypothetical protein